MAASLNLQQAIKSGGLTISNAPSKNTAVVGQTVSSPYYNPGTKINSSTGKVIGNPAPGPTLPKPGTNPLAKGQVLGAMTSNPGGGSSAPSGPQNLSDIGIDVTKAFSSWGADAQNRAEQLGGQIEQQAREAADREYNDTLNALRGQKEEVNTLSGQQRDTVNRQVTQGTQDLTDKQTTEETSINKQRTQFKSDVQDQQDQLARQWRDMSLETQSIMRGSGRDSSSYAATKESGLLSEFNQGLRVLSQKATDTLADFSSALDETTKYYTRAKADLAQQGQDQLTQIDNWVRQSISSIQNQENVALSTKFNQINAAILQAQTLKTQTAQKISDQQLGLATWLAQVKVQMQTAVASAAQGKLQSAAQGIKDTQSLVALTQSLLTSPSGQIAKNADGTYSIHGSLPQQDGTYQDYSIPVSANYVNNQVISTAGNLSKLYPGVTGNQLTGLASQSLGLPSNTVQTQQPAASSGGGISSILGAIGNFFTGK